MKQTDKIKSILFIIALLLIIAWIYLSMALFYSQIIKIQGYFTNLRFLTLEEKHELVDNGFYLFMKDCACKIPENEDVAFVLTPPPEFGGHDWLQREYFIQKAPYYLYQRRVFREDSQNFVNYVLAYDFKNKTFNLRKKPNK